MSAKVLKIDREKYRYKMKDLCQATGLDRQAVHFYIQQGLLPPGHKTGRNMAWYTEEHLERLKLIKQLQHERFLPLKAIKALLDGREEAFAPEQQAFLQRVREKIDMPDMRVREGARVDVADVLARTGMDEDDVERAEKRGIITVFRDEHGHAQMSEDDVWLFELVSETRMMGFTKDRGFEVDDLAFYHDAVSDLLRKEVGLLSSRLSHIPPEEASLMIQRALPVINQAVGRLHMRLVRDFFGAYPEAQSAPQNNEDN